MRSVSQAFNLIQRSGDGEERRGEKRAPLLQLGSKAFEPTQPLTVTTTDTGCPRAVFILNNRKLSARGNLPSPQGCRLAKKASVPMGGEPLRNRQPKLAQSIIFYLPPFSLARGSREEIVFSVEPSGVTSNIISNFGRVESDCLWRCYQSVAAKHL